MTKIKGFAAAQRHKGGYDKWVYDMIKALYLAIDSIEGADTTEIESAITALQTAIGDEDTADSILGRIKALETPANPGETPGSGGE